VQPRCAPATHRLCGTGARLARPAARAGWLPRSHASSPSAPSPDSRPPPPPPRPASTPSQPPASPPPSPPSGPSPRPPTRLPPTPSPAPPASAPLTSSNRSSSPSPPPSRPTSTVRDKALLVEWNLHLGVPYLQTSRTRQPARARFLLLALDVAEDGRAGGGGEEARRVGEVHVEVAVRERGGEGAVDRFSFPVMALRVVVYC